MTSEDLLSVLHPSLTKKQKAILDQFLAERDVEMEELRAQLAKVRHMAFERSSEKIPPMSDEVRRALNADEVSAVEARLIAAAQASATDKKTGAAESHTAKATRIVGRNKSEGERKRKRQGRIDKLPIVVDVIDVAEGEWPEGMTATDFRKVNSPGIVRRYSMVRSHLVTVEYRLTKYQHVEQSNRFVQAKAPASPTLGGIYESSVHAWVITQRLQNSMPLNRLAKDMQRQGAEIAPSTLIAMYHRAAALLSPIYERLLYTVRHAEYVFADETSQPVLCPGKGSTVRGWIWVGLCGEAVVYWFSMGRGGDDAANFLGLDIPNLMADGYSSYSCVVLNGKRSACWSHGRRDFYLLGVGPKRKEVHPDDPKKPPPDRIPLAAKLLYLIQDLYVHEGRAVLAGYTDQERVDYRKTHCGPVVDEIFRIAYGVKAAWEPKLPFAKACAYLTNREPELRRFLDDANIPLDNNISERALRVIALGRRNSLFVGPNENGKSLATLLSVVRTCDLLKIDAYDYLADVLPRLATIAAEHGDTEAGHTAAAVHYDGLTPAAWRAEQLARTPVPPTA
jgi:transposase